MSRRLTTLGLLDPRARASAIAIAATIGGRVIGSDILFGYRYGWRGQELG